MVCDLLNKAGALSAPKPEGPLSHLRCRSYAPKVSPTTIYSSEANGMRRTARETSWLRRVCGVLSPAYSGSFVPVKGDSIPKKEAGNGSALPKLWCHHNTNFFLLSELFGRPMPRFGTSKIKQIRSTSFENRYCIFCRATRTASEFVQDLIRLGRIFQPPRELSQYWLRVCCIIAQL